jgi:hypothetical protein
VLSKTTVEKPWTKAEALSEKLRSLGIDPDQL